MAGDLTRFPARHAASYKPATLVVPVRTLPALLILLVACPETPKDTATPDVVVDVDGDGWDIGYDCDDEVDTVHPNAEEVCNGIDDDCDGEIDDGVMSSWYADNDEDGFGSGEAFVACEPPLGTAANADDCDDADARYNPAAEEWDCNDPNDYNCDGSVDFADDDADGFAACDECDDNNAAINPAAIELCNAVDDDCDGDIDEADATDALTGYADADGDGFGDLSAPITACELPEGYVADASDCDDTNAAVNPAAVELCNTADDDCDGAIDEADAADAVTWYADADVDGYGDAATSTVACDAPAGFLADATDCDDTNAAVNPAATEVCNGLDDDCDSGIDESDAADAAIWYADTDADSFGDAASPTPACAAPFGYVADSTDCNDADAAVNPAATEVCNGVDDDCDGTTDEPDAADASAWYADADGDLFGDAAVGATACEAPVGYVSDATDCDDSLAAVNPAATELCNGRDDDCDGTTDEPDAFGSATWYADADTDGFGDAASTAPGCDAPAGYVADNTDCNDALAAVNPAATELCNGLDDDCDALTDEPDAADAATWYADADGDRYGDLATTTVACDVPAGYLADNTDCDDTNAAVNPAASEACNGYDDDCDGSIDEAGATGASTWYADADGDAYGNASSTTLACDAPAGYVADATDCNDALASVFPGATEVCNSYDDDCDGSIDEGVGSGTWYADADGDSYGDPDTSVTSCSAPSGYVADDSDCDDTDPGEPGWVTSAIQGTDSVSTSPLATWRDDRVRAYTNSGYDVAGWVKFDLSTVTAGAVVTEAYFNLHGENAYGSPAYGPAVVIYQSVVDSWTRGTVAPSTITRDDLVSVGITTSFTATGWNSLEIDVAAWDYATDIADGWVTFGVDNPRTYYSYVYFNGTDTAAVRPELELTYFGCD
ncbi:hypothetical protein LBMAG42_32530 [Deltaproteobacteria bacterium]|nr:hypothetical protein LBMAG42_32530 [Deltaproteobacteria bacterium]